MNNITQIINKLETTQACTCQEAAILGETKSIEEAKGYIDNILQNISYITDDKECLPTYQEIIIKNEHPEVCYNRVVDDYFLTILAQTNERFGLLSKKENIDKILSIYNTNRSYVGGIEPEIFFKNSVIKIIFGNFLQEQNIKINKWDKIKSLHKQIEINVSALFDFLAIVGYKSDNIKEYRSMMHDVTHAIYGTKADILITNDKRFYNRILAIYSYLEIPTEVVFLKNLRKVLNNAK